MISLILTHIYLICFVGLPLYIIFWILIPKVPSKPGYTGNSRVDGLGGWKV